MLISGHAPQYVVTLESFAKKPSDEKNITASFPVPALLLHRQRFATKSGQRVQPSIGSSQ